ncbi:class I SAM-dependent methyltransferase [Halorarum halophilum]|uniref:Class I SAM-dependent methyltransferase n=1 Tax=Halorarum halophilum TaxID=2743090 RepID=A0A7D5GCW2_9EURY|nr:class I SAM-dependent methyltransferase [Halobaculum halophilum]QLG28505.1 class I SAM-dependent methyltransferase [Halobaculum halophilum]
MSDGDGSDPADGAPEGFSGDDYDGENPASHEAQRAVNRDNWDERALVHPDTDHYDVDGFLDGDSTLHSIERERVDAEGTLLCHLMCHFGLDTLSWAREGADPVGVDFSPEAIERARTLRDETGLDAEFVEADVYDAPATLDRRFEAVVATYGVFCWLPDLRGFFETVATLLEPGGEALFVDDHPIGQAFDGNPPTWTYPYHDPVEMRIESGETYADDDVELSKNVTYQYYRPLSAIVTAAADAGLRVSSLEEFPFAEWPCFEGLEREGEWYVQESEPRVPLLFALEVEKPA